MNLFIVIPTFNEGKSIRETIIKVKGETPEANIVVVDDGSIDNTFKQVKETGVKVLRHVINRGQGATLQTGNEYAVRNGADIVVHFDGDGQHRVEDIKKIIQPILDKEVEVVLGSRFLDKNSNIPFTKKFFILKPAIILNWFFTGLRLTDVHNGFRAMSRVAAKKIKITQDRMAHNTEIISEINKNKLKYKEVPVQIIYNEYGQGFFDGFKILKDLIIKKIL
ncbi:glycosyltransferase family 2 protein [Candidatus Falkowbacteria bacterium]|nr:glycosyltransferase family 2 protein [Candidatus Falkowbacteria bacterium]MBT4433224.1 glycosyltransferase family 2 protein [Candidatus Falkowbacteria bacterium]